MNEPQRGMNVIGVEGPIGTVDDVIYEPVGGAARVVVNRSDGRSMVLQPGSYHIEDGDLRLDIGGRFELERGGSLSEENSDIFRTQRLNVGESVETLEVAPGESRVIPVIREEVRVSRREVEHGGVRVHKRVEEREELVEQPIYREEVTVERVMLGRPVEAPIAPRQEGDTLIIPVLEEMLVVEKRLVLKEEIRITKRRFEETEQARVLLREEHVDIEELGDDRTLA
jgi:uncharacterized protein (TIGR02271 family)